MPRAKKQANTSLLDNPRFYVLSGTVFLSIFIVSMLRLFVAGDAAYYEQLSSVFAWTAIAYWYVVLMITPARSLFGDGDRMALWQKLRRPLGVSVAYFGLLHIAVVMTQQIDSVSDIRLLPSTFQWSFVWGLLAILILLMLSVTSLDRVVAWLTIPEWKKLHKMVYLGGVFALLHAWMIGQTIATRPVRMVLFVAAALFFSLEAIRFSRWVISKNSAMKEYRQFLSAVFVGITLAILVLASQTINNYTQYHSQHTGSPKVDIGDIHAH